jgi:uncharacterized protein YgiM (DUF1202 family)
LKKLMIAIGLAGTLASTSRPPAGVVHAAMLQAANLAAATPSAIVATAEAHLGDRYATIGNSPATGFSCIGFVNYVFAQNGVYVPFDIPQAWNSAPRVALNDLLPGDVLFFSNTVFAGLSHVAIYIGGGAMIGADNFSVGVTTDRLSDSYWTDHYTGATRPLALGGTAPAPGTGQSTATATPPSASGNPDQTTTPTPTQAATTGGDGQAGAPTVTETPAPQTAATAPSGTLLRLLAPAGLYSGPGYQYTPVANADAGSLLTVLLGQGDWYSVRQGTTYGWVSARQVVPISGSGAQAPPATAQATPTPAFSRAALTTSGSGAADLYVVQGPLWVRSGPGTSFHPVGSLVVGTPLRVRATHPHWALVTAPDNITGWVARPYLGPTPPTRDSRTDGAPGTATPVATLGFARVTTAMLNVRVQPDRQARAITVLFGGETVRVLIRRVGWDQVMLRHGVVGWADAAWLTDQAGYGNQGDRGDQGNQ